MRFASKITGRVELGDTVVEIHALSAKKLEKANDGARGEGLVAAKAAGAELVKAFHELARAEKAGEITPDVKRKARYAQYERPVVLRAGITRITPEVDIEVLLEDCLEEDLQKIHEAILDLSLPPLDPDEAAAVPKAEAAPSSAS